MNPIRRSLGFSAAALLLATAASRAQQAPESVPAGGLPGQALPPAAPPAITTPPTTMPSAAFITGVPGRNGEVVLVRTLPSNEVGIFAVDANGAIVGASTVGPYLGVSVSPPDETLRSQLKLPEGTGLVVNWVDEKSAAHGQLMLHDVLTKIDDQLLINVEQFATLVRMHSPGQALNVTVIRQSQPIVVSVKLTEKNAAALDQKIRAMMPVGLPPSVPADWKILRAEPPPNDNVHDRAAILRRLSLDLTGQMPSPGEIEAFENDKSPDAYEKMLDRLLQQQARWRVEPTNGNSPKDVPPEAPRPVVPPPGK